MILLTKNQVTSKRCRSGIKKKIGLVLVSFMTNKSNQIKKLNKLNRQDCSYCTQIKFYKTLLSLIIYFPDKKGTDKTSFQSLSRTKFGERRLEKLGECLCCSLIIGFDL